MESPSDTHLVLSGPASAEIKIKGSRFVAEASPVASIGEADDMLAALKKRDYDATHHCSAYRIGPDGSTFRYNDDGEPSSSAGLPIYRQILARNLTDTMVVVIRYYGGTKLGTGGLVRAYGDAAAAALDLAPVKEIIPRTQASIQFSYDDTSPVMHIIGLHDVEILDTKYTDQTRILLGVRTSQLDAFSKALTEALSGRGQFTVQSEISPV